MRLGEEKSSRRLEEVNVSCTGGVRRYTSSFSYVDTLCTSAPTWFWIVPTSVPLTTRISGAETVLDACDSVLGLVAYRLIRSYTESELVLCAEVPKGEVAYGTDPFRGRDCGEKRGLVSVGVGHRNLNG